MLTSNFQMTRSHHDISARHVAFSSVNSRKCTSQFYFE